MNKICIWCRGSEADVTFSRPAHIFPQSLGGKRVCRNVCDSCNFYFGSKQSKIPSVEIALKEPLNISKVYLLSQVNKGKSQRFKSEYFEYNLQNHLIKPKLKYRLITDFQKMFAKQFKRGIYKIFLEERSESIGDALDSRFDFIGEFSRYGIGDYPAYYCQPKSPAIFASVPDIENPVIRFTDYSENIMKQFGFYSYFFMTHTIAIPIIRNYEITLDNYIKFILTSEKGVYSKIIPLKNITDLDFIFSFAN